MQKDYDIRVDKKLACHLLRTHFNMSFRKLTRVNFVGNLDRALVLRQHYAKTMLALLAE